jgi:hypothetical protein
LVDDSEDRSPVTTVSAPGAAEVASLARWAFRAWSTTEWPREMSRWATAEPRPSEEPVMKMRAIFLYLVL